MDFTALDLPGVFQIVPQRIADERGFFARTFCAEEMAAQGLVGRFAQSSVSFNAVRGTVRGMHFSVAPHAETKLVRCTAGAIAEVLVDLRAGSPAYLRSVSLTLSADNGHAVYIPAGVAHGFQTLSDATEVLYMIDVPYVAAAARGIRWNDPAVSVEWPLPISIIAARDLGYPDWAAREAAP